jgi:hypothetical protein
VEEMKPLNSIVVSAGGCERRCERAWAIGGRLTCVNGVPIPQHLYRSISHQSWQGERMLSHTLILQAPMPISIGAAVLDAMLVIPVPVMTMPVVAIGIMDWLMSMPDIDSMVMDSV